MPRNNTENSEQKMSTLTITESNTGQGENKHDYNTSIVESQNLPT